MTDKYTTHGTPSWSELMTTDPASASEFYGHLFGWKFDVMPMPDGDYHVASLGDEKVAGIMAIPDNAKGTPPNWGQYVTVGDVDAVAQQVSQLGGTVLVPPTDIPGVGRFILFQDPQGAALSAIQYAESEGN